jgi:hypothetical protein
MRDSCHQILQIILYSSNCRSKVLKEFIKTYYNNETLNNEELFINSSECYDKEQNVLFKFIIIKSKFTFQIFIDREKTDKINSLLYNLYIGNIQEINKNESLDFNYSIRFRDYDTNFFTYYALTYKQ